MKCIFCPNPLSAETKYEHIIQESIGGSLKSRALVCNQCNEEFSRAIDLVLAQKYARIMNALGPDLPGKPPMLDLVDKESKKRLRLESGMVPQITRAEILESQDGRKTIKGATADHVNKIARQIWNKPAATFTYDTAEEVGKFEANAPLLHEEEFRAITKTCLEYLRYIDKASFDEIDFSVAQEYVRHDKMPPKRICFIQADAHRYRAEFDRRIPNHPFCHRIGISIGPRGVQAVILLFNSIPYRIKLSSTAFSKKVSYLYQRNILRNAPANSALTLEEEFDWGDFDFGVLPPEEVMKLEGARVIQLCADADWHVSLTCEKHIVESYLWTFKRGRKPGEDISITPAAMLDAIFDRVEKVFLKNATPEEHVESKKIREALKKKPQSAFAERIDHFSDPLKATLWQIHLEVFQLHKKYVTSPKSRYKSLGLFSK